VPRALPTWPTSIVLLLFATPVLAQPPAPAPSAPSKAVPAAATGSPAERPYTINPGDQIEVYVWGDERLQRTVHVLPDGTFTFPLVGRVVA
jgi:polysaccharide export outer membrane protein